MSCSGPVKAGYTERLEEVNFSEGPGVRKAADGHAPRLLLLRPCPSGSPEKLKLPKIGWVMFGASIKLLFDSILQALNKHQLTFKHGHREGNNIPHKL